jgi:hypothetical protein
MKSIDDICRDIVRKRDSRDYRCPYGRRLSFDDLWEADKNHLRETVKIALESAQDRDIRGPDSEREEAWNLIADFAETYADVITAGLRAQSPAPTGAGEAEKLIAAFDDFLNEPPAYESEKRVREYRHKAYRQWQKLVAALRRAQPPQQTGAQPVAWQWRYVGDEEWNTPSGGTKLDEATLKRERPIEQRPLFAARPTGDAEGLVEQVAAAIQAVNKNTEGLRFSELTREMAREAVRIVTVAADSRLAELERHCDWNVENNKKLRSMADGNECWLALRRILNDCSYPWEGDGLTADQAYNYIKECFDDLNRMHRETIDNPAAARMEAAEWRQHSKHASEVANGDRIFDLLESVCAQIDNKVSGGANDLRAAFARATGGVDLEYLSKRFADAITRGGI